MARLLMKHLISSFTILLVLPNGGAFDRNYLAREGHKLKSRLSRGEKPNRKRMATVTAATVYNIELHIRAPEHIMGLEEDPSPKPGRRGVVSGSGLATSC
jgi:hypothetical protein